MSHFGPGCTSQLFESESELTAGGRIFWTLCHAAVQDRTTNLAPLTKSPPANLSSSPSDTVAQRAQTQNKLMRREKESRKRLQDKRETSSSWSCALFCLGRCSWQAFGLRTTASGAVSEGQGGRGVMGAAGEGYLEGVWGDHEVEGTYYASTVKGYLITPRTCEHGHLAGPVQFR